MKSPRAFIVITVLILTLISGSNADTSPAKAAALRGVFFNPQFKAGPDFPWLLQYESCRPEIQSALQELADTAHINFVSIFVNIAHSLRTDAVGPSPGQPIAEWANLAYYDNVSTFIDDCAEKGIVVEIDLASNLWTPYSADPDHQVCNGGHWPKPDDTPWDEAATWYAETIEYIEAHTARPEAIAMWSMSGNAEWGTAEPCLWNSAPAVQTAAEHVVKQCWPAFRAAGKRPKASPILLPIFSKSPYWMAKTPQERLSAFTNCKKWLVDDLKMPPDYWVMSSYPNCEPAPDGFSYLRAIVDILGKENAARIISTDFKGPGHDAERTESIIDSKGMSDTDLLNWHFQKCSEYGFGGWWIWAYQDTPSSTTGLRTVAGEWKMPLLESVCAQRRSATASRKLFSDADLAAFRARINSPENAAQRGQLIDAANALITAGTEGYADPGIVASGGDERPEKLRGNYYGGRLVNGMETLGFAYALTNDARYAQHAVKLLVAAAQTLPIAQPPMSQSYMDGVGAMMRGLALGYDFFAPQLTPQERASVESAARAYVEFTLAEAAKPKQWWAPYHNYSGAAYGGAGALAIAVRDAFPHEAQGWIDTCAAGLTKWFDMAFDAQGAYIEGTSYCEYGLRQPVLFMYALKNAGGPDLFQHPHLRNVAQYFALSQLPGETVFDARNDAYYKGLANPLWRCVAQNQHSGLLRWLWDNTGAHGTWNELVWTCDVLPVAPDAAGIPLTVHFPDRGLVIARTGWSSDALLFSVEAGPFQRKIHNQADKGSFNLYGYGHRWAIDGGYGNTQTPNGPAQTIAHNAVLIDGHGQAISGAGLGTNGHVTAFKDESNYTYIALDCTDAYRMNSDGQVGVALRQALRYVWFVKPTAGTPAFLVIADDIDVDDAPHAYTWQMHTESGIQISTNADKATLSPSNANGPHLNAAFFADCNVQAEVRAYADNPVLVATVNANRLHLVSMLFPLRANETEPKLARTGGPDSISLDVTTLEHTWKFQWETGGVPEMAARQ